MLGGKHSPNLVLPKPNSLEAPQRVPIAPGAQAPPRTWAEPYLHISQELGQVEMPLLHEAGELQNEAHRVVGLLQARQTLHRPHCIQALGGERGRMGRGRYLTHLSCPPRGGEVLGTQTEMAV